MIINENMMMHRQIIAANHDPVLSATASGAPYECLFVTRNHGTNEGNNKSTTVRTALKSEDISDVHAESLVYYGNFCEHCKQVVR